MKVNITLHKRNGEIEQRIGVPLGQISILKKAPAGEIVDFDVEPYISPEDVGQANRQKLNALVGRKV